MIFIVDIFQKTRQCLVRFPLVLLWVIAGSCFMMVLYGTGDYGIIEKYKSISYTLILGVSWLIGVQLLSEGLKHNLVHRITYNILALLGLGLFYYYLEFVDKDFSAVALGRWLLMCLAGHVFIGFSPFVKSFNTPVFWNYLKTILVELSKSLSFSFIIFSGLSLAILALEFLFGINFNSDVYLQIFIFCIGIVNTFLYLNDFPSLEELDKPVCFNKVIEVLILYILIPLSVLYLTIVYAYAVKILIQWELPNGWVTYLISILSILAFVIHIAIEPIRRKHKMRLVRLFFPYFFFLIIPLIPLLFVALSKRILDYNFTEYRYLGLLLALWIMIMVVYMLVAKTKPLSIYAKFLFFFIMISSFGPLSASKVSISAQTKELTQLMNDLYAKEEAVFTYQEFMRFRSIVVYLEDRNALGKTESVFGFNPQKSFLKTPSYQLARKIVDTLNITVQKEKASQTSPKLYRRYSLSNFKLNYAEEITDYTYFTELQLDDTTNSDLALQMVFDANNVIRFLHYGDVLFESDMTSQLKAMAETYENLSDASQDEFTFRFKNDKGDFLVIFSNLRYTYKTQSVQIQDGKVKLFYRTFELLELP